MKTFIPMVKISGLNSFSGVTHGFSERSFAKLKKERIEFKLGPIWDPKTNRAHVKWFLESLNIDESEIYFLKQVHSDRVFVLDDPLMSTREVFQIQADAIVTHLANKPIGVLTADCIPIIVYDPHRKIIGAVHAGRKGTGAEILSKTVNLLKNLYQCSPQDIRLGIGPGIGPCCYEVGKACLEPFRKNFKAWESFIRPSRSGKIFLDLIHANREDGKKAGLQEENIFISDHCTACENPRFYSYRKEGICGRNVALAMLTHTS